MQHSSAVTAALTNPRYINEALGTFFFTLAVAWGGGIAAFAVLTAFIYAGAHISGAHYNPAVTFGIWLRGSLPRHEVIPYMLSQALGAIIAAVLFDLLMYVYVMNPLWLQMASAQKIALLPSLLVEFFFTFALIYVVLNVATTEETKHNSYFGLAIGAVILAATYAIGGISSAVLNPAVALALVIMKTMHWYNLWIYLIATFAGGAVAAYAFKAVHPRELKD